MPVYKFRSFAEAEEALWLPTCDPRLAKRLRSLWRASWEMAGRFVPPRGIFKFRSIEEANAHREKWEDERIRKIQRERAGQQAATVDPSKDHKAPSQG